MLFLEQLIFDRSPRFHTVTLSMFELVINPNDTGVFRLRLPGIGQNGATLTESFQ